MAMDGMIPLGAESWSFFLYSLLQHKQMKLSAAKHRG